MSEREREREREREGEREREKGWGYHTVEKKCTDKSTTLKSDVRYLNTNFKK